MMEDFGVHTFRLVNERGEARFVKFHWKPRLGVHSVLWDEALKISGKDPDFHRRDLWEAIEGGPLEEGVIAGGDGHVAKVAAEFIKSITQHRAWSREAKGQRIPV